MGRIADQFDALTVTVKSPDANIQVVLRNEGLQSVRFRPGSYEDYRERALEHQLAQVAILAYVGFERGVRQIMDGSEAEFVTEPNQATTLAQKEFLQGLREIKVEGSTPLRLVRFRIDGLANWRCRIAEGALEQLDEPAFVAEAAAAARDLLQHNRLEKATLKAECFGSRPVAPHR